MNNIVIWVIVAVVVLGGAYYLWGGSLTGALTQTRQVQDTTTESGAYTGSLSDLAMRGGDWKCTTTSTTAEASSSGTVYVAGTKMRGEFSSTVAGAGTMQSYMVNDGEYIYTWSSAAPQGMKMLAPVGGDAEVAPPTSGQGADLTQAYSYDCAPWSVDASLLMPPTGISFMEFSMPQ